MGTRTAFFRFLCAALLVAISTGTGSAQSLSDSMVVKAGGSVSTHFLCRLPDGRVAVSTAAIPDGLPVSPLYIAPVENDPVELTAGEGDVSSEADYRRSFEDAVIARISHEIVGLSEGERRKVELRAQRIPPRKGSDGTLTLSRTRIRTLETRIPKDQFVLRVGREAARGRLVAFDTFMLSRVSSVSDNEVLLRLPVSPSGEVETSFGKGKARDLGDGRVEIRIDPVVGEAVRTGPLAGRILRVRDDDFTIDYGHPFAGEVLTCEVTVVSIGGKSKGSDGNP